MSKCRSGGGRRRYTSAEHAVGLYLKLCAQVSGLQALDYEIACNRVDGGKGGVQSEPVGLDDLMALREVLESLRGESEARKWRVWELQRLNLMSSRDTAKLYNEEWLAAGGARVDCISHTTAQKWRVELDAALEGGLYRVGLIMVRVDGRED
jgi:hypothetical protein